MKNIFAIIIIISSLIILLNKKIALRNSWKKTNAILVETRKVLDKKNMGEIRYKYNIGKNEYEGSQMMEINDEFNKYSDENNKIKVYYHKINPEISVRNIPSITTEDYLLAGIGIIGGLYLYLFSCENCVCEVNYNKNNLPQVKLSNV